MTAILTVTMNPAIDVSASTERVVPTHKLRCKDVRREPGGGGINVARVVRRLGGDCRALYPVGGSSGRRLQRLLDDEGIESIVVDAINETRESFTILDQTSHDQYRLLLPGEKLGDKEWQTCLDQISSLAEPPDYIVASGSLPPGVPDDFYANLAVVAGEVGSRIVVDTSGPALAAAFDQGVYLVKPNLRELRDLTGLPLNREQQQRSAADMLVCSGKAEIVALTLGKEGALLVHGDRHVRASAVPTEIVSAVGAGHSFLGAMVWSLSEGEAVENAFRYAIAAGSAALLTPGTELARKEDIERVFDQVFLNYL